jgi:hypothetical protein
MSRPPRRAAGRATTPATPSDAAGGPHAAPFPPLARLVEPRGPYFAPLVALLATRALAAFTIPLASEDAYITFRYARSLASGAGLVFNPGERVMGFTSPLWTLWSALGIAWFGDPLIWVRATAIAADAVALVVVTRMLERHVDRAGAWAFAVPFAIWPFMPALAVSGMETGVMVAFAALAAALAAGRSAWSGPALAGLALLRPEGAAMAAVVALWARGRDRLAALALAAAGWGALALYFGSPIPQSLRSKAAIYGTPGPWAGRLWWDWLSPLPLGRWPELLDFAAMFPLTVVIAPAFVLGVRALYRDRPAPLTAFAAALAAVWAGYAILGVAYFWWYAVVPLVATVTVAAAGLPAMGHRRAVWLSAGLFVLGSWTTLPTLYIGRARAEARTFAQAADWLRRNAAPGDRVLLEPIGMIGWWAPVEVIDEVGLVSPDLAARRMRGPGWYADVVGERRPTWLVVRPVVFSSGSAFAGAGAPFRSATERDRVLAAYDRVQRIAEPPRPPDLDIYRRRE